MSTTETPLDQAKLDAFVGRFLGDLGTAMHMPTVLVGDRLGLYRAMADGEPLSPADLAERTGTNDRYVAEWLLEGRPSLDLSLFDPTRFAGAPAAAHGPDAE